MLVSRPIVRNLILADDDEDDRSVFIDVIGEINSAIRVETVSDGLQLMKLLKDFAPDILFLDLDMPHKNGLECIIEIRNNPALKDLFTVVFSSTTRPANIQTAYEMGAHLFLRKESSFTEYKSALKSILQFNWKEPQNIKQQYCFNSNYVAFG